MKKVFILVLAVLMMIAFIGYTSRGLCTGVYKDKKLYINGEPTYIQLIRFHDTYVTMPLHAVLRELGAEWAGGNAWDHHLRLNSTYFIFDFDRHMVFMEDEDGYSEYMQQEPPQRLKRWNRETSVLSESCTDSDDYYVSWFSKGSIEVLIDHKTMINLLAAAGIDLQISIDYEQEVVYMKTSTVY